MKKYPEFSKEEIEHIVKQCFTFSDVCRLMQRPTNSGNLRVIHKKLDTLNIDYSHFKGQGWNKGTSQPSHKKIQIEKILSKKKLSQKINLIVLIIKVLFQKVMKQMKLKNFCLTQTIKIKLFLKSFIYFLIVLN